MSAPTELLRDPIVHDIEVARGRQSLDYPGDKASARQLISRINDGGPCDLSSLIVSAHSGTHIDLPAHFVAGGTATSQLAPETFLLPAQVVDIRDLGAVRASDLQEQRYTLICQPLKIADCEASPVRAILLGSE